MRATEQKEFCWQWNKIGGMTIAIVLLFFAAIAQPAGLDAMNDHNTDSREMQKLASRVYESAVKMYAEGKYWDATQEFIVLIDYYPEFTQIDGVYYYVAEALSQLEMNKPAKQAYKWLILKYPQSKYAPKALLGLEKIAFRENDHNNVLQYYYAILKKYSEDEALTPARYYAGQSLFHLKKWDQSIIIFKRIDEKSEYYDYSLYTIALSMVKKKESGKRLSI
jgi:TolA-binding protein